MQTKSGKHPASAQGCSVCCCGNVLFFGERTSVYGSFSREKRLSPRRAPRQSLLPHSPRRTQVRLKPTPVATWMTPVLHQTHGRPLLQEYRLRLKRPTPNAARRCPPFKSSTAFRALAPAASFRGPLCFASGQKIMAHHIFQIESELQNIPEAALKSSPAMVLPRYLAWNTSPCLLAKSPSLSP